MIDRLVEYLTKYRVRLKKDLIQPGFLVERLLREMYYDVFKIVDFNDVNKPLAVVEYTPVDGLNELGPTYSRIREYRIYSIYERYHISLIDFLTLPVNITQMLIQESRLGLEQSSKQQKQAEAAARAKLRREGMDKSLTL